MSLYALGSALKRKRLDGTTFKYLNLGVLLSIVIYTYVRVDESQYVAYLCTILDKVT